LARLSVPRTIELDDEDNTLCNAMVSAWVAEYAAKGGAADAAFVSPAMYCLTKLLEMKSMSAHLVAEHPFRVAVVCDLFAKLCGHPQYSILRPLKSELFGILLADFEAARADYSVYDYLRLFSLQQERNRGEWVSTSGTEKKNVINVKEKQALAAKEEAQQRLMSEAHKLPASIVTKLCLYQNHWQVVQERAHHTLKFIVLRVWARFTRIQLHRAKMYPKLQIFESLHPGRNKVFKSWRRAAHYISMRKMQTELSDSHRTIAQLNVRNQNLQVEMVALEKRSNDHIAQLTMELYHKNMDENTALQFGELRRNLSVKWIRYLAQLNIRVLARRKEQLELLFEDAQLADPYCIAYTLGIVRNLYSLDLEMELLAASETETSNLRTLPLEALALNWANYVLFFHKIENKSAMLRDLDEDTHRPGTARKTTASRKSRRDSVDLNQMQSLWSRGINNLSEDWRNGNAYLTLLVLLAETTDSSQHHLLNDLHDLSPESKVAMVVAHLTKLGVNADRLLRAADILDGDENMNLLILARLMAHPAHCKIRGANKLLYGVSEAVELLENTLFRANKLYKSRKGREVSDIMKFQLEVDGVLSEAATRLSEVAAFDALWQRRMLDAAALSQRFLARRLFCRVRLESRVMLEHDPLTRARLGRLTHDVDLDAMARCIPQLNAVGKTEKERADHCAEQLERIKLIVVRFDAALVRLFAFFAQMTEKKKIARKERTLSEDELLAPGGYAPGLRFAEFIQLLQFTRICDAQFTVANVCDLFSSAEESAKSQAMSYQRLEFSCASFVVALLKVAKYKFVGQGRTADLAYRVELLFDAHLKKFVANPFLNDTAQSLEVQAIVCPFEHKLKRVYAACVNISIILRERLKQTEASRNRGGAQSGDEMWKKYATVAGTAQVLNKDCSVQKEFPAVSEKVIIRAMHQIQNFKPHSANEPAAPGSPSTRRNSTSATDPFYQSVVFEEFVQLIMALALFAQPSPFVVKNTKIQNFLNALKMRKTRKTQF